MKSDSRNRRTLGPVSDLERHLPADWWRTLFNALYLQTDGDVVENDDNTRPEVDFIISTLKLKPTDRILDLCCGQGRHSLELARRGFRHVTGLDRSRYLLRLARQRAKDAGLAVKFREGDARRFTCPDHGFNAVILMGNSFGYFDQEEDDLAILGSVMRALRPGGKILIDIADGEWMREHFEPRAWEWIDENQFVCRERSLSADRDRLISREVIVHAEKGVIADQFYAERLYSRARISRLLGRAGCRKISFHGSLAAQSTRGGLDLGMMAHRLLITARAPKITAAVAGPRGPLYPDITVILGDPRRPDTVKRDGTFNDEDLDTVQRLKDAAAELRNYRFTYLDNHASLLSDLRDDRPAFVLNFCDEGFNNEATLELHVPAILEALAVPYSGAGPAALGLCYNKALVRAVAAACDVPVPLETYYDGADRSATIPSVFPALMKPCMGDSSVGITQDAVVNDPAEAVAYLAKLRQSFPGQPILIQEFLAGREYSVGMVGNPGIDLVALPMLEVDYTGLDPDLPRILSYESKWLPDSPYWEDIRYREAEVRDDRRRQMIDWSSLLFQRLGCRDYARFDFRTDNNGVVKLLEVNPNPGWCWDGKLNLMAGFAGHSYADLLRMIIETAERRIAADGQAAAVAAEPASAGAVA